MKCGKYLVSLITVFGPEVHFCTTLKQVKKKIERYEPNEYRLFKVNQNGLIQRCTSNGHLV